MAAEMGGGAAEELFRLFGWVEVNRDEAVKDLQAIDRQAKKTADVMGRESDKAGERSKQASEKARRAWEESLERTAQRARKTGDLMTRHVTLPLVALAAAAVAAAVKIDDAYDNIRAGTGATGAALEDLKRDFQDVAKRVPQDVLVVAQAIADLNTRTGATGETLRTLATQMLDLARLTQEDVGTQVASVTRLFGDWSIASQQQSAALDYLYRVSQTTGISVSRLAQVMVQYGAPMRQVGFQFETAAALMGKFEKEGVNLELVMGSLRIGLVQFARAGVEPIEALEGIMQRIKETGSAAEANALAMQIFGARAGADMASAIREGRFEIDELLQTLKNSKETIAGATRDTYGFSEMLGKLRNAAILMMERLGAPLVAALERNMPVLERLIQTLTDVFDWFSKLPAPIQSAAFYFGIFTALLGPALILFSNVTIAVRNIGTAYVFLAGKVASANIVLRGSLVLLGRLGLIAAAVTATIGAATLALKKFDINFPRFLESQLNPKSPAERNRAYLESMANTLDQNSLESQILRIQRMADQAAAGLTPEQMQRLLAGDGEGDGDGGTAARTVADVRKDAASRLRAAAVMEAKLGQDFDLNAAKVGIFNQALQELSEMSGPEAGKAMDDFVARLRRVQAEQALAADATQRTAQALQQLTELRQQHADAEATARAKMEMSYELTAEDELKLANQAADHREAERQAAEAALAAAERRNAPEAELKQLREEVTRATLAELQSIGKIRQATAQVAADAEREARARWDANRATTAANERLRQARNERLQAAGLIGKADLLAQEEMILAEMEQAATPGTPAYAAAQRGDPNAYSGDEAELEAQRAKVLALRQEVAAMRREGLASLRSLGEERARLLAAMTETLQDDLQVAREIERARRADVAAADAALAAAVKRQAPEEEIARLKEDAAGAENALLIASDEVLRLQQRIADETEREAQARRDAQQALRDAEDALWEAQAGEGMLAQLEATQRRIQRLQEDAQRARDDLQQARDRYGSDSPEAIQAEAAWKRVQADILTEQGRLWDETGGKFAEALWDYKRDKGTIQSYFRQLFEDLAKQQFVTWFKRMFGTAFSAAFSGLPGMDGVTSTPGEMAPEQQTFLHGISGTPTIAPGPAPVPVPTSTATPTWMRYLGTAGMLAGAVSSLQGTAGMSSGMAGLSGALTGYSAASMTASMLGVGLNPVVGIVAALGGALLGMSNADKAQEELAEKQRDEMIRQMSEVNNKLTEANDYLRRGAFGAVPGATAYTGQTLEVALAIQTRRGVI